MDKLNTESRQQQAKERRIGVAKKASAIVSLLLSAGGTTMANLSNETGPAATFVSSESPATSGPRTETIIGLHDVAPEVPLPGVRVNILDDFESTTKTSGRFVEEEVTSVERVATENRAQRMVWARLFDKDPDARKTADTAGEITATVDVVKDLIDQGYTIDDIRIHGYASDEDDTTWQTGRPGAGLNVDSPKNVKLAEERADAVHKLFGEMSAQEINGVSLPVRVTGGAEKRDEVLNETLFQLADSRGESVQAMIVKWNRGQHGSFTDAELDVLNGLAEHRYVSIEVDASKTVTETHHVWREGEWVTVTEEHQEAAVVIIPVIIPFVRRKKGEQEDDSTPEADTPTDSSQPDGGNSVSTPKLQGDRIWGLSGPEGIGGGYNTMHTIGRVGLAVAANGKSNLDNSYTMGRTGPTEAVTGFAPFVIGPAHELNPRVVNPVTIPDPIPIPVPYPLPVLPRPEPLPTNSTEQQAWFIQDTMELHPGYGAVVGNRKQPGRLNNGGNHGTRGQRNRGKFKVR